MARRHVVLSFALAAVSAGALSAQCPDGVPPPCGGRRPSTARPATLPPLDSRTWMVVPFANVARVADVDWVRDASVNLLTLEIGRWNDVKVVDDKRVGDLLLTLPDARRNQALTLSEGLQLARRAGAGMLVMGDFVRVGQGVRLSASVIDVRSGNRVRAAEQRAGAGDSLLKAFGPLARSALALPPPADAMSGEIGTQSLEAYKEYLAGVRKSNLFQLEEALAHLTRALSIDSTFALAHLQLALVRIWGDAGIGDARSNVVAAQRLGASLPPRERALITWAVHFSAVEYARACDAVAPLVARDTMDVQASFLLGDCAFHDRRVIAPPNDSLTGQPRYGFNVALRSLRRVLSLDPNFHTAYVHVLDVLQSPTWTGSAPTLSGRTTDLYRGVVLREGDSLLIQPVSVTRNGLAYAAQVNRSKRERPMTANLALAKGIAEDWVTADPRNAAATSALANVLMLQGDIAGADARMRRMTTTAFAGNNAELRLRMDIAIKLGRADEARAWFDSLVKAIPDAPNINTQRGSLELAFGRAGRFVAGLTTHPFYRTGPAGAAYVRAIPRMLMGLPVTNLGELERDFYASITDTTNCDPGCRHERLAFSQQQALGQARTVLLDYGTPEKPHGSRAGRALARRDTAWLRHLATDYDTAARNDIVRLWPDGGGSAIAAEMYLALGDSAKALKTLRFAIDTAMMVMPGPSLLRFGVVQQSVWTGTMLHRAQLADAFGLKDEARKWYDRVLDLWAKADAEFQPDIARIRAARARLDGPVP